MGLNETEGGLTSVEFLQIYTYIKIHIYMNLKSEWINEVTLVPRHARKTLLGLFKDISLKFGFFLKLLVFKNCFNFEVGPNNFDRFINAVEIHSTYEFRTKMVKKCSSLNQLN